MRLCQMHVFRKAFEIINETWAAGPKLLRYDLFVLLPKAYGSAANFRELFQVSTLQIQSSSSVRFDTGHSSTDTRHALRLSPGCATEV
jgi:hypothetical protein